MLSQMSEEAEDDEMLPLSQIGLMMVDWIDPFKAMWVLTSIDEAHEDWHVHSGREGSTIDTSVHLDLSVEVLKLILIETSRMCPGMLVIEHWWRKRNADDSRKALASLLSKLTLPEGEEADSSTLKSVLALICAIRDKRPLSDAPSRNAVTKFESVLLKKWPQILEAFDEDAFRGEGTEKEGVQELFGFIDDV